MKKSRMITQRIRYKGFVRFIVFGLGAVTFLSGNATAFAVESFADRDAAVYETEPAGDTISIT